MTTKTKRNAIRTLIISLFTLCSVAGTALAYGISPLDIVEAGGTCVGERCYFNGHAYHCVGGKCTLDVSR